MLGAPLVAFVVGLLVGGFAIHVAASLLTAGSTYGRAVLTAAIGALAWALTASLVGAIPLLGPTPLLGPALALLAYLAVIKWQYQTGWLGAGLVAVVAWFAAAAVLHILSTFGIGVTPIGIPGR